MPAPRLPVAQTYAALRQSVQTVLVKGQQEIERSRVRTYWETGRLLNEHLLLNKDRADYGTATVQRLANDIQVDRSVLQRCMQFVRAFPSCAAWHKLTWGHYRALIPVEDPAQRRALATEADRHTWSVSQLEQKIRALTPIKPTALPAPSEPPSLLTPRRGTPGIYQVVAMPDGASALSGAAGVAVDLGFACFVDLPPDTTLPAGAFVRLDTAGRIRPAPDATQADLYTYPVTLLKLVDGDTLWVKIHLGQRHWLKQKLRLRDLDCPEMNTAEGKAARRFVETLLGQTTGLTITTTKPDKYDRYLADVFLVSATAQSSEALAKEGEIYLNNALLAHGHAVLKHAWEFKDWDPELA